MRDLHFSTSLCGLNPRDCLARRTERQKALFDWNHQIAEDDDMAVEPLLADQSNPGFPLSNVAGRLITLCFTAVAGRPTSETKRSLPRSRRPTHEKIVQQPSICPKAVASLKIPNAASVQITSNGTISTQLDKRSIGGGAQCGKPHLNV